MASKKRFLLPLGAVALLLLIPGIGMGHDGSQFFSPLPLTPTPDILNSEEDFRAEDWIFLGTSVATYYGTKQDGYLGRRHAASWNDETPPDFSERVVKCCEPGIALSALWGVDHGAEVLVVWEKKHLAVSAVRIDAKPGWGADLYEWLYRALSPKDIGPLKISLYLRRSIWDLGWAGRFLIGSEEP